MGLVAFIVVRENVKDIKTSVGEVKEAVKKLEERMSNSESNHHAQVEVNKSQERFGQLILDQLREIRSHLATLVQNQREDNQK